MLTDWVGGDRMLKCPLWQWPRGAGDILICSLGPKCSGDEERSFVSRLLKGRPPFIAGHRQELQAPAPRPATVVALAS